MFKIAKKRSKTIFLLIGIISLFTISEIAFFTVNKPYNNIYMLFELAKLGAKMKNADVALFLLSTATNIAIKESSNVYPDIVPENYSTKFTLPDNKELKDGICNYIINSDPLVLTKEKKYKLPKILYDLALLSTKNGNKNIFPSFLESAFYIDPQLSYWAIEYANYYYSEGQKDKALEILDRCAKLKFPKQRCEETTELFISNIQPYQLGFLTDLINDSYTFKLPFNEK